MKISEAIAQPAVEDALREYLSDYEFRGDSDYMPTEHERLLIEDAARGLLVDEAFVAALTAALSPPPVDGVEAGVEVRVAVAMEPGTGNLGILGIQDNDSKRRWKELAMLDFTLPLAIITARVPLPSVPVVPGVVGEAGE